MTDLSGRCGTCIFFTEWQKAADGTQVGECRLGCWPSPLAATRTCGSYRTRGERPAPFDLGRGRGGGRGGGSSERGRSEPAHWRADPHEEVDFGMDRAELKELLRELILEEMGVLETPIGERWAGGELVIKPGRAETQEKRVPLEAFFHKIVMLRDRLRVLEQKINANGKLTDTEKVDLQQYVTRCYGSLTTFNVLFRDKEDQFSGQKGDD